MVWACGPLLQTGDDRDVEAGVRLLRQALVARPDDAETLSTLGLALTTDPLRWREARDFTARAVALEPHDPAAWFVHAKVLKEHVARRGRAREAAERAVDLAPSRRWWPCCSEIAHAETNPLTAGRGEAGPRRPRLALDPEQPDAHVLRAKADYDGPSSRRQEAYLEAARLDPSGTTRSSRHDGPTFPLRMGFWLMGLLVAVQAVLIAVGVDLGTVLGLLALLVVLPLAWVGFLVVRTEAPPDPAAPAGSTPCLSHGAVSPPQRPAVPAVHPCRGAVVRWAGCVSPSCCGRAVPHPRRRRRRWFGG